MSSKGFVLSRGRLAELHIGIGLAHVCVALLAALAARLENDLLFVGTVMVSVLWVPPLFSRLPPLVRTSRRFQVLKWSSLTLLAGEVVLGPLLVLTFGYAIGSPVIALLSIIPFAVTTPRPWLETISMATLVTTAVATGCLGLLAVGESVWVPLLLSVYGAVGYRFSAGAFLDLRASTSE